MYQQKLEQYFAQHEEQILNDIMALCRIRSVKEEAQAGKPYGEGPAKALAAALDLAGKMGFATKNYDNYVMSADYNDKQTELAILAHLDVVHEGTGWTVCQPYEPVVKNGRLYGRGTADDKGPAVVVLWALKALKDLGIDLQKNVRVILGTDEECGSSDLKYYFAIETAPPYSFSPDSAYPVTNIEKGGFRGEFTKEWSESTALPRILSIDGGKAGNIVPQECTAVLEGISSADCTQYFAKAGNIQFTATEEGGKTVIRALGESAHAAKPHLGKNALTGMLAVLCAMPFADSEGFTALKAVNLLLPHGDTEGAALGVKQQDDLSGPLTLCFSIFNYSTTKLYGKFDSRTPICANEDNMSKVVQAKMAEHGLIVPATTMNPPHHTPADSPFVKTLNEVYEAYSGQKGGCEAIGGGTYVHHIDGGVAFGCSMPGTENFMHGPDESAVIAELLMSAKIFAEVIIKVCGVN